MASDAVAAKPANPLLAGPILPTLLRLTLPNLAAMLVTALVAIAETAYVGILGTTQLAAIALGFPLMMLMQMLSAGAMGGGVSSAVGSGLGRRQARAPGRGHRGACPGHRRFGLGALFTALILTVGPL